MQYVEALHRVWAEAIYELALAEGLVDEFEEELAGLASLFHEVPTMKAFVMSPSIKGEEKRATLKKALEGKVHPTVFNFVMVASEKNRLGQLDGFAEAFTAIVDQAGGRQRVRLTSAVELAEELRGQVHGTLEQQLGKKVILEPSTDPAILGGLVIQYGDTRIDGSVRRRLAEFKKQLREKIRQPAVQS